MTPGKLIACHECDLLQREVAVPEGGVLRCRRCRAQLYRALPNSLDRALAFSLAAAVLFAVSNLYPIVGLSVNGTVEFFSSSQSMAEIKEPGVVYPLSLAHAATEQALSSS